jgi:hypothetical protein
MTRRCPPTLLLLPAMILLFSSAARPAETKLPADPPATFLQTNVPGWQRILATEITADFHAASIHEVIDSIAPQAHANIVLSLAAPPKAPPPFTHKFQRVPLRTVLYQLSRATGLKIDWAFEDGIPRAISIHNR